MNNLKLRAYRLLRWSEKYTKTDMVYVGKSGFWLTASQMVGVVISFILSILFAKYLSKDTFGIYKYILSVAGVVSAFSLTGMNTVIVRAVSQGHDGTFEKSLPIQFRWTIVQFLLNILIAFYYFFNSNYAYGVAFLVIAVCGPISTVTNSFASYLQGKQDFKTPSLYGIYSNIIYFATLAPIIFYSSNFLYLIVGYFVSSACTNTYFCFRTLKKFPKKNSEIRSEDVTYAKKLSLMTIIGSIAYQIDSIIVYQFLGPVQLAIYSFSIIIPDRIRSILGIITVAALPKLSLQKNTTTSEGIIRKEFQLFFLATILALGYIAVAPFFYKIFFPQYIEAIWYSQLYMLSIFVLPSFISIPSLYAQKKEAALYTINVALPIVKIIVSLVTILLWGILGAIVAKLIHYLLQVTLSGYFAVSKPSR
jgi:O-antigen/teichoic acid export membrane protein